MRILLVKILSLLIHKLIIKRKYKSIFVDAILIDRFEVKLLEYLPDGSVDYIIIMGLIKLKLTKNINTKGKIEGLHENDVSRWGYLKSIKTKDELLNYIIRYVLDELQAYSNDTVKFHYQMIINKYYEIIKENKHTSLKIEGDSSCIDKKRIKDYF